MLLVFCAAPSALRLHVQVLPAEPDSTHPRLRRLLQDPTAPREQGTPTVNASWFQNYISDARETQLRVFREIIGNNSKVVLLNLLPHASAKDEALTSLGLLRILDEMNVKAIRHCSTGVDTACVGELLEAPTQDTSIIVQLALSSTQHSDMDKAIADTIRKFHDCDVTFFLSGDWWEDDVTNRAFRNIASQMEHVSMVVTSPHVYKILSKFHSIKSSLTPHLGLSMGSQERFTAPLYDVIWSLDRSQYKIAETCDNLPSSWSCDVRGVDRNWPIPKGHDLLDNSYTTVYLSLLHFLRGRTAVVEGLSGHVLCSLLNIPHVIMSSRPDVTSYVKHWLAEEHGTGQVVLGGDSRTAAELVQYLLEANMAVLPERSSLIRNIKKFWM